MSTIVLTARIGLLEINKPSKLNYIKIFKYNININATNYQLIITVWS